MDSEEMWIGKMRLRDNLLIWIVVYWDSPIEWMLRTRLAPLRGLMPYSSWIISASELGSIATYPSSSQEYTPCTSSTYCLGTICWQLATKEHTFSAIYCTHLDTIIYDMVQMNSNLLVVSVSKICLKVLNYAIRWICRSIHHLTHSSVAGLMQLFFR